MFCSVKAREIGHRSESTSFAILPCKTAGILMLLAVLPFSFWNSSWALPCHWHQRYLSYSYRRDMADVLTQWLVTAQREKNLQHGGLCRCLSSGQLHQEQEAEVFLTASSSSQLTGTVQCVKNYPNPTILFLWYTEWLVTQNRSCMWNEKITWTVHLAENEKSLNTHY